MSEHTIYFYYHHINNPSIEYCVYIDLLIYNRQEYFNTTFIKQLTNEIYQVFLIDKSIKITASTSIFHKRKYKKVYITYIITNPNDIKTLIDEYTINRINDDKYNVVEWGTKHNIESPWSSNLKDVINSRLYQYIHIQRIEKYTRVTLNDKTSYTYFNANYDYIIHDKFSYLRGKVLHNIKNLNNIVNTIITGDKHNLNILDGHQLIKYNELEYYNKEYSLALDNSDLQWFKNLYNKLNRDLTKLEIYDLAQSNSEHSRHWIFNSRIIIDGIPYDKTLFNMVKNTLKHSRIVSNNLNLEDNSRLAFCDNSSCIKGYECHIQSKDINSKQIDYIQRLTHPTLTAETHNFPTGIAPFEGANTGVGGRIRDSLATGTGADIIASLAGYCVGNLDSNNTWDYSQLPQTPKKILINASNGASDYGNKVGEPIIGGFCRSVGIDIMNEDDTEEHYHFFKPIMFNAGLGYVLEKNTDKIFNNITMDPETLEHYNTRLLNNNDNFKNIKNDNETKVLNHDKKYLLCSVGGIAYPVGLGGGSSSSLNQNQGSNASRYDNAVQRGDPEMGCRLVNFFRTLVNSDYNPILSLHDQGAGGPANVIKELVELTGGSVYLDMFKLGDKDMTPLQIYCSEFQEQCWFLIDDMDYEYISQIAESENIHISRIGFTNPYSSNNKTIDVFNNHYNNSNSNKIISLPIDYVLSDIPQKELKCSSILPKRKQITKPQFINVSAKIHHINITITKLLNSVSICSKKFLTNKVDRSVSGLIAQQQCVGPNHLPLSNYSIVKMDYDSRKGVASSIGEGSINGLTNDYNSFSCKIVAEMLTNLMGCVITGIKNIKCSANWMWAPKYSEQEAYKMVTAVKSLSDTLIKLGIAIDGGKDSVSMVSSCFYKNTKQVEKVLSPPTLVLTSYVTVDDVMNKVTPDLKKEGNHIYYIPMNNIPYYFPLGGSNYQVLEGVLYGDSPTLLDLDYVILVFNTIQKMITDKVITSLHDISDGGMIVTLLEMCFGGNLGINIDLTGINNVDNLPYINTIDNLGNEDWSESILFSEAPGIIVEVDSRYNNMFIELLQSSEILYNYLGNITNYNIRILYLGNELVNKSIATLRYQWEITSYKLEAHQMNESLIEKEKLMITYLEKPKLEIPTTIWSKMIETQQHINHIRNKTLINIDSVSRPRVLILREVGSNGHREMIYNFHTVGFEVYEKTMVEFEKQSSLSQYNGLVFVGGFSNADIPFSGSAWSYKLMSNNQISQSFKDFTERHNTFTLGICNGCQVINKLEYISQDFNLLHNESGKFESRWSYIRIENDQNIFFRGMGGLQFGIWSAHGEGNFQLIDNTKSLSDIDYHKVASYVNPYESTTNVEYPHNPNGSVDNIVGLVSECGRHLMMMPHPERCTLDYQVPYLPDEVNARYKKIGIEQPVTITPWMLMFKNLYDFCCNNEI